jgi:hypothetical protein
MVPQDDDDNRSVDVGSNPDVVLAAHLHDHSVTLIAPLQAVT